MTWFGVALVLGTVAWCAGAAGCMWVVAILAYDEVMASTAGPVITATARNIQTRLHRAVSACTVTDVNHAKRPPGAANTRTA